MFCMLYSNVLHALYDAVAFYLFVALTSCKVFEGREYYVTF